MNKINIKGDFNEFFDELDENNYHILEEEVDINLQNSYFKTSRSLSDKMDKETLITKAPLLQDKGTSDESKKEILCQLATSNDVKIHRILEQHLRQFDTEELNNWSILAFNESRMILNGSLRNQQQIFISTGLGGKSGKFRYFIVLQPTEEHNKFTEFSRTFIKKELEFTLKSYQAEIEKWIDDKEEFISFKVLIPFKANIPKVFKTVLDNCNQLTPFVSERFIITNVGEMNNDEITDFINNENWDEEIADNIVSLN